MKKTLATAAALALASSGVILTTTPAHAATYVVKVTYVRQSGANVATYTDSGKNCSSGRKVLYAGQSRAGVTCVRSAWTMDAFRTGASDLLNVAPYTEVKIPSGGAYIELTDARA